MSQVKMVELIDNNDKLNTIDVEWCSNQELEFSAKWADSGSGAGYLTLSKSQAKMLLTFLKDTLED